MQQTANWISNCELQGNLNIKGQYQKSDENECMDALFRIIKQANTIIFWNKGSDEPAYQRKHVLCL